MQLLIISWIYKILLQLINIYLLLLLVRALLSWVSLFNSGWRPRNTIVLTALNLVYALTEPPLRFLGKYLKPLNIGGVGIDLSFMALVVGLLLLESLISQGFYLIIGYIYGVY